MNYLETLDSRFQGTDGIVPLRTLLKPSILCFKIP